MPGNVGRCALCLSRRMRFLVSTMAQRRMQKHRALLISVIPATGSKSYAVARERAGNVFVWRSRYDLTIRNDDKTFEYAISRALEGAR